ncbi:MAG TPA: hypothetical protein VGH80_09815 [Xanthomonadaceae bacterium]|jgi:ATP-dependent protease ClpP protease subunit
MSIESRIQLYEEMERVRSRPLLVYVTSARQNAHGMIAGDVVHELLMQLNRLPHRASELDLLLVSNGGDPTVAWRVVSLIRESVKKLSVLVPQAAFSAATLIALGADEIVMHPHGNLGPTDPQISSPKRGGAQGTADSVPFGSEDLAAFLKFARETVGLSDQEQMRSIFTKFCDEVGSVAIGIAARSSQLSVVMGERLLQLHMTGDGEKQKARAIAEKLTRDFFHHGYPVSRTEAVEIGLRVAQRDQAVESIMWKIWADLGEELELREPFLAITALARDPAAAPLFAPPTMQLVPTGQLVDAAAGLSVSVPFQTIHAVMESARLATRCITTGKITGIRQPNGQPALTLVNEGTAWKTIAPSHPVTPPAIRSATPPASGGKRRAVPPPVVGRSAAKPRKTRSPRK